MKLIEQDLTGLGYIFLNQPHQSADLTDRFVKYMEWTKLDQNTSIDNRIVVRIYRDNGKVIIYRGGSVEHFRTPEMLFNGKIETVELLELVYNLVK